MEFVFYDFSKIFHVSVTFKNVYKNIKIKLSNFKNILWCNYIIISKIKEKEKTYSYLWPDEPIPLYCFQVWYFILLVIHSTCEAFHLIWLNKPYIWFCKIFHSFLASFQFCFFLRVSISLLNSILISWTGFLILFTGSSWSWNSFRGLWSLSLL